MRIRAEKLMAFLLVFVPVTAFAETAVGVTSGSALVSDNVVTPDELGALVSPIAFVDACQSIRQISKGGVDEKPIDVVFIRVVEEFCRGMVVAVVSTMRAAPQHEVNGQRVCLMPSLTPELVINEIQSSIARDPKPFEGRLVPQVDTPAAI